MNDSICSLNSALARIKNIRRIIEIDMVVKSSIVPCLFFIRRQSWAGAAATKSE